MIYLFLFIAGIGASVLFSERNRTDFSSQAFPLLKKYRGGEKTNRVYSERPVCVHMHQGVHVSGEMDLWVKGDRLLLQDDSSQYVIAFDDIVRISINQPKRTTARSSAFKKILPQSPVERGYYVAIGYRNTANKFKMLTLHLPGGNREVLEKLSHIV